jgi:hypothetical protein
MVPYTTTKGGIQPVLYSAKNRTLVPAAHYCTM